MQNLLFYLVTINIVSCLMTVYDKQCAIKGKKGVKDTVLLLVSIFGGSISMFVTMHIIQHKTKNNKFILCIISSLLLQIIILLITNTLLYILPFYLLIISIISFVVTIYDKQQAIEGKWRIKESTLFLLSILGGSVSMYIAMLICRHKTKKLKFRLGIPCIITCQFLIYILAQIIYTKVMVMALNGA